MNRWLRFSLVICLVNILFLCLGAKGCPWEKEDEENPWKSDQDEEIVCGSSGQKIIKASVNSIIDTYDDSNLPACEVSVPAGAVTSDIEVSLTSFSQKEDLPVPLPDGYELLGGADLKPTHPGAVSFASCKEGNAYIILPPSVQAEELSTADIRLMEFIDGHWVIVLPNKKGKIITTGPKTGYIGPDDSAPAKLTGVRPWCWVRVTPPADITPPSIPIGFIAIVISSSQINLSWDTSMDDVGVAGYRIYRDGTLIGTSSSASYSDTGLSASTTYSYTVAAYDQAGNISDQSSPVDATTLSASDITPPSIPTGLIATVISSSQIDLSWNVSTDNIGVVGYKVYRDGVQVATTASTSYSDLGLNPDTTYNYTIAAYDAAGNTSNQSAPASATTSFVGGEEGTWIAISTINAPLARYGHTAVWTGSKMIVWGGHYYGGGGSGGSFLNTGGVYNPATDTWIPTSLTNAPSKRMDHTVIWTGSKMIIWGGWNGASLLNTGGIYDPATNTWAPTSNTNAPSARSRHTAIWTGTKMIIWGGYAEPAPSTNTGGIYDPATDSWDTTNYPNLINGVGAPSPRNFHTAIWTGSKMIAWGGYPYTNTGGVYDPNTDSWTATSSTELLEREWHTAIWTGSRMIVWGGLCGLGLVGTLNTGGVYDPATDTWVPTTATDVPSPRRSHTAIWTGTKMIIWGGVGTEWGSSTNTGGIYDPVMDTWVPTSTTNVPSPRFLHTTVWTGTKIIIWGGLKDGYNYLNTGGIYTPPK